MQSIRAANTAALAKRHLLVREFLWITARDRDSGDDFEQGYWSGIGTKSFAVYNPDSEAVETRSFFGAGELIQIGPVVRASNMTVQTISIVCNHLASRVDDIHRLYDLRQARIELYVGYLDADTHELVAAAEPKFLGFVNEATNTTPPEGNFGQFTMSCTSHTQEVTRSNHLKRSDASQKLRSSTDNFYADVAVVGDWPLWWGKETDVEVDTDTDTGT